MILEIKNLEKNFGGIRALDRCSMALEKGRITVVIGPNGSGKTTLFNAVFNNIRKDGGSILFAGADITENEDFEIAKAGMARTFQEVRLFRYLTIRDHLEIASSTDDESLGAIFRKKADTTKKIKEILALVGLQMPSDTLVTELSFGQRKLLDLATALAKPHTLLLLDEPVAGVNPLLRKKIKALLQRLKEKGETILLIEHDMDFVMDLADNIFVMDYGRVIAHGRPKEIQNNKKVLEAYLGE